MQVKDLAFAAELAVVNADGMLARITVVYDPVDRTGPMAMVVTATASLELSKEQYQKMMTPAKPK